MVLIDHNARILTDNWRLLEDAADWERGLTDNGTTPDHAVLPLMPWLALYELNRTCTRCCGVVLEGSDDPAKLLPHLAQIERIAIRIPRFTDGRGYSLARLLRSRYAFRGQLRAIGDIQCDQLGYLHRVGFDSFLLRDDQDLSAAQAAFRAFSVAYQASADQALPLFRRRAALA